MPDYSTGKIYKIINPQNEVVYIGSTIQKLSSRFAKHTHKGNGNRIILLEHYPCSCKEELCMKEQEVIEQYDNLLNQYRAYNSSEYNKEHNKEYYKNNIDKISEKSIERYKNNKDKILEINKLYRENNRDKILEINKKYYEENKNKISEKDKIKVLCECGCEIRKRSISRHKQSRKHIKLMKSNTIKEQYK